MDNKNQTEETETHPRFVAYVQLLSTAFVVGAVIGVGTEVGRDAVNATKGKIQKLRKTRAAKKKLKIAK